MAKPKLALIPSAQGSKFYSVLPSSGVGDFNFSRSGSATRINSQGLIETVASGVSRLNYPLIDGVVNGCPSHLLEPLRSNIIPYSESFSNAAWIKGSSTINPNQVISPDGTLNADLMVTSAAGGGVSDGIGGSGNYSFSVFVKYKDIQFIRLRSTSSYAWFDIENGSVGTTISALDAKIENYGNGWYRCTLVGNNTNTIVQVTCTERNATNVGFGSVYLWGVQFEAGSYETSYIKSNSGGTVTRSAETANGSGDADTFNDSQGVLYAEVKGFKELPSDSGYITISSPSVSFTNAVVLQFRSNGDLRFYFGGSASANIQFLNSSFDFSENNKIAVQYDSNGSNYKMFVNGVSISRYGPATNQSVTGLSELNLNYSTLPFVGNVKDVKVYNNGLTDNELETLTSWVSFQDMANGQLYSIK